MQTFKEVKRKKRPPITEQQREDFDTEFNKALGYPYTPDDIRGDDDSVPKSTTDKDGEADSITSDVVGKSVLDDASVESVIERLVRERKERLNVS